MSAIRIVTVASVVAALGKVGSEKPVLVDVRGLDEFTSSLGHVAGSLLAPLPSLNDKLIAEVAAATGDRPLVVICRSGGRARTAAGLFASSGKFKSAIEVMDGGMLQWNREGHPVETAAPPAARS